MARKAYSEQEREQEGQREGDRLEQVLPEQLCQRHQIRGAGIRRTALPLGHRLPADAQCLRHKFLRHLARRPALFQHLADRALSAFSFLTGSDRMYFLSALISSTTTYIVTARIARDTADKISVTCIAPTSFPAASIPSSLRLHHQPSRNFSVAPHFFMGKKTTARGSLVVKQ